jgi:hypothetical protein
MSNKILGRTLLIIGAILLIVLFAWEVFSEELNIIEVRRNIPLSDTDPIYRDFYINGGKSAGLKTNMLITATRKTAVRDATGSQNYGELLIPVGQLKIIFVSDKIAVAREHKLLPRDAQPMLEQMGLMIGDQVSVKENN